MEPSPVAPSPPVPGYPPLPEEEPASDEQERSRRITDLTREALGRPDPLEANLGAMTAELMQLTHNLHARIKDALDRGAQNIEQLSKIQPALDIYLRLTRQVDRFSQHQLRERQSRRRALADGRDPMFYS